MPEGRAVQSMFAGISRRYDLANHLLSGGVDLYWRRRLVKAVAAAQPTRLADLATGSGDVAFALARALPNLTIHALDFCEPMLDEARAKQAQRHGTQSITFAFGDCLALPLDDASIDAITISFGLRNLEDRHAGLREMLRVLKPGGSLFVLEFTQPAPWFKPFYFVYLKAVLPLLARVATGNRAAYEYLAGSIESFPSVPALSKEIHAAGFDPVHATPLTAAIVAIHQGIKP